MREGWLRTRKSIGIMYGRSPLHIVCTSFANEPDNSPFEPIGFSVLTAFFQRPSRKFVNDHLLLQKQKNSLAKNCANGSVALKHCIGAFI